MDVKPLLDMFDSMHTVAREGCYRERVELLGTLETLSWFDNFGYGVYLKRMLVVREIDHRLEEIPSEHEQLVKEARETMEADA